MVERGCGTRSSGRRKAVVMLTIELHLGRLVLHHRCGPSTFYFRNAPTCLSNNHFV